MCWKYLPVYSKSFLFRFHIYNAARAAVNCGQGGQVNNFNIV